LGADDPLEPLAEHVRRVDRAVALAVERPERLLCVVGPTASGKTDLAIDVCARIGGEVISADSVQIYRGFDLVLAPSLSMAAHLRDWGIARVHCQPLGVDSEVFHPSQRDPAWRARHGIDADARLLVYAGRFAAEKHLDVVAEAVMRLGAPYTLLVIGAGPVPPPPGPGVVVMPFVASTAALATAYASADAFVHAGDQETFGLSALEAMACGLPIVVRDAEGLGELVDRDNGVAVADASPASFAAGIAALFEGDWHQRSRAARLRAEASDWQRVLPSLVAHYLRLIAGESAVAAPGTTPAGALPR